MVSIDAFREASKGTQIVKNYNSMGDYVRDVAKAYTGSSNNLKDLLTLVHAAMRDFIYGSYKGEDRLPLYEQLRDFEREIVHLHLTSWRAFLPWGLGERYRAQFHGYSEYAIETSLERLRDREYECLLYSELKKENALLMEKYQALLMKTSQNDT